MRKIAPRRAMAQLVTSTLNPVEILVEQNRHRLTDLAPLRFARSRHAGYPEKTIRRIAGKVVRT